ncbi:histidine kinase [Sphingobacterium sp. lm-10]|uniref:sensor histidine kinase n=1 Tax=Sphingobacterium sp. lm-10 TaxID=2944904 RepID=UPI00202109E3|nr:ATP-binding protein [Sphingobacterium sp. lm-10]MCL7986938.1 histidine kinase [Sphingobacterium sp. lm-10]
MKGCRWLIGVILSLAAYSASAQSMRDIQEYGDSIYQTIKVRPDNEDKAFALLDLSFFWGDYDTAQAFQYIEQAQTLFPKNKDHAFQGGVIDFYRASAYFDADPDKAKQLYMAAEKNLKQINTERATRYRIRLWSSYGALLQREGRAREYVEALITRVIPMATAIRDTSLLGNNYQNVAMALMNMQDYKKADRYYKQAISMLRDESASDEHRLTAYVNAARNAIFQQHLDQAKVLLQLAAKTLDLIPLSTYGPMYYTVYGSYWKKKGNWEKAFAQFDKGLAMARTLQSESLAATVLFDQYEAYRDAGRLPQARQSLLEVLPYVESSAIWRNKQRLYYNLAIIENDLGNYQQSAAWYKKYAAVVDTLTSDANETRILELEKKYQTAEKERELLLTQEKNQAQQISLIRTRGWIVTLLFCCILLLMFVFIGYSSLRNRKRLNAQKDKLQIFNAMAHGEEQERSRIARDLHDGLGGILAGIKLKLSAIVSQATPNARTAQIAEKDPLQELIHQVDYSVDEVRRVARNMMPESLRTMGLESALSDLCRSMQHAGLQVNFSATNLSGDYDQRFLLGTYRIAQELLTNTVRHSGASRAWLQCSEDTPHFYLSIEDNGRGFDKSKTETGSSGIGLQNIQNRVDLLNGQIEIDTAPGQGVSIHITLYTHV